jgi:hypothetical protein
MGNNASSRPVFLTVTHNGHGHIAKLLGSIPEGSRVVIVDNASSDQTLEAARPFNGPLGLEIVTLPGDVNDLIFANGFVYAATSNPQREIQIFKFDYIQNDLNPVASIDLPSQAVAVDFKDNKIVFAAGNKLYIYEQD